MNHIRVGVLRGGPSNEYDVSLKSGATVLKNLAGGSGLNSSSNTYVPHDIFIDRAGVWHMSGLPLQPHDALNRVDVVVNALHGNYGEDGKVQFILDNHGIPYTGSGSLESAIAMNKVLTKKHLTQNDVTIDKFSGVKIPRHDLIELNSITDDDELEARLLAIFRSFTLPVVVKPVMGGSSLGVSIVKGFHEFEDALIEAFKAGKEVGCETVMVEEFIPGVEASCGVINNFRDQEIYALPPIEIRPTHGKFFDYDAKYNGHSQEIVPGNFTHEIKEEIMRLARLAHQKLGLRHYSRSDFIVTPRRGVYLIEVNTLPGLTDASLLPKALTAVGVSMPQFLDHIISLAIAEK